MAQLQIFSVFDKAIGAFMRPFYQLTNAAAIRDFEEAVTQQDGPFKKHPGDFTLFVLGTFNDQNGLFTSVEPQRVIGALECVAKVDQMNANGRSPAPAS